ncbi:hypothetical protein HNP48_001934 [Acidovorax soli]|uniref:Uncharacterized protein n=1 Tax=Acidovorax soli TaxID=592050 RepID=A0A7X0PCY7_9BURK|nr:hypothetical protein [Acidovorax soli]
MGRHKTPSGERLRAALAFRALRQDTGLSYYQLSKSYLRETDPKKYEEMLRVPNRFRRYSRGETPKSREGRDRLTWSMKRSDLFRSTYESPLFVLLQMKGDSRALKRFSLKAQSSHLIARSVRPLSRWAVFGIPGELENLTACTHIDALCLLLLCFRMQVGKEDESMCAIACVDWFRAWSKAMQDREIELLMLNALTDHVPQLSPYLQELHLGLTADSNLKM